MWARDRTWEKLYILRQRRTQQLHFLLVGQQILIVLVSARVQGALIQVEKWILIDFFFKFQSTKIYTGS